MQFEAQCFEALSQMHLEKESGLYYGELGPIRTFLDVSFLPSDGDAESVFKSDPKGSEEAIHRHGNSETMFLGQSSLLGPHPRLDFAEVK